MLLFFDKTFVGEVLNEVQKESLIVYFSMHEENKYLIYEKLHSIFFLKDLKFTKFAPIK